MSRKSHDISITVQEPLALPDGVSHKATTMYISRTLDFDNPLIALSAIVDIRERKFSIDLYEDETIYVKTKYIYDSPENENGYEESHFSRISSLRGDQEGIYISDTVVLTPSLKMTLDRSNDANGELKLKGNEFGMYTSHGTHKSSSWVLKDLDGGIIYEALEDEEALTELTLPKSITKDMNFIAELTYHSYPVAKSNPGRLYNIKQTDNMSLFTVEQVGRLVVGRPQYFKVSLRTINFVDLKITIKDNLGTVVKELEGVKSLSPKVITDDLEVGMIYTFEFRVNLGVQYTQPIKITAIASDKAFIYDEDKEYLNEYDYKHLIMTSGKTAQFSCQLYNGTILLSENNTKTVSLYKYMGDSLIKVTDLIDLPVNENILIPSLYVNQFYNGDVMVCYTSKDEDDLGTVYIKLYDFNPVTDSFTLKHSKTLDKKNIVKPGSITTTWSNEVYYIKYGEEENYLTKYDFYTDTEVDYTLPFYVKNSISCVRNLKDDIIILGGTNTSDLIYGDEYGVRDNHKVFKFDTSSETFTEIGEDLLLNLDRDFYQFHAVSRHDGKVMLFNTLDNGNTEKVGDQSTIVIDTDTAEVLKMDNDHVDEIPYLGTIVLKNGDIIRFSSLGSDPQKLYAYIADSMLLGNVDDNDNISYTPNELIVRKDEVVTKEFIGNYDIVRVEDNGILHIVTNKYRETFTSEWMILTRDTVMTSSEYQALGYSGIFQYGDIDVIIEDESF